MGEKILSPYKIIHHHTEIFSARCLVAGKLAIDATVFKDIESILDFSKACIDALISEGEGIGELFMEGAVGGEPVGLAA